MSDRRGFDRIIGQELAKRVLGKALRQGQPTSAYLFLGMEGAGKSTTALEFAKALNCENLREGSPCGECAVCRAIEHGNFPDIRLWSREAKRRDTTIDQMREMREHANFKPIRGRWKVNIIEQGDTLNAEAANCILKLLEEPPEYLVNVLIYQNAAAVLPTIRSRCQCVRFTPVNLDELATRLEEDFGASKEQAEFLAAYSLGCPGKAITLLNSSLFFQRRDAVIEMASASSSASPWQALRLSETLRTIGDMVSSSAGRTSRRAQEGESDGDSDEPDTDPSAIPTEQTKSEERPASARRSAVRKGLVEALDMLLLWYRDLLAAKSAGESAGVMNSDRFEQVLAQSRRFSDERHLADAVDAVLLAKRRVLGNANVQIATDALFMRLWQLVTLGGAARTTR